VTDPAQQLYSTIDQMKSVAGPPAATPTAKKSVSRKMAKK